MEAMEKLNFGWGPSRLEAVADSDGTHFAFVWNGRVAGEFECSHEDLRHLLEEGTAVRLGEHSLSKEGRNFWYVGRDEGGHRMRVELERIGLEKLLAAATA
jgi:hypothetical protein